MRQDFVLFMVEISILLACKRATNSQVFALFAVLAVTCWDNPILDYLWIIWINTTSNQLMTHVLNVLLWMGQRNPASPTGWYFNPTKSWDVYHLSTGDNRISVAHPPKWGERGLVALRSSNMVWVQSPIDFVDFPSERNLIYIYIYTYIYIYWKTSLFSRTLESWLIRGIMPKWPLFRLVKYCNLPRQLWNNHYISLYDR